MKDGARFVRVDFDWSRSGSGSEFSESVIETSMMVEQGLLPISALTEQQQREAHAFIAKAAVEGVSSTYYRDLLERRRNEAIGKVARIKWQEKEIQRRKAPCGVIGRFLAVAIRREARARGRRRAFPVDPNPEVARLVAEITTLELRLIDFGTRTRKPDDHDQSRLLRQKRLAQIVAKMLGKSDT